MKDLYNSLSVAHLMDAQDITNHTDIGSDYVDVAPFDSAVFVVNYGTVTNTDASNKVLATLQECDTAPGTNTSWTDVATTDIQGAFTVVDGSGDDQTTQRVGYIGGKRYVRVKLDFTSAGANPDHCPVAIDAILSSARHGNPPLVTPTTAASTA